MPHWRQILLDAGNDVEGRFDALKSRLGQRLGRNHPLQVVPYRTYGTPDKLFVKGRVLQDEGVRSAREDDDMWDNLLNMYRRFESDEVPFAHVRLSYGGGARELVADEEGYFQAWINTGSGPEQADQDPRQRATGEPDETGQAAHAGAGKRPDPDAAPEAAPSAELASEGLWRQVNVELIEPVSPNGPVQATAFVLVPPPTARFGVISDIDDTVVRTDATHFLRMARTVFLGNARLRLPFEGVGGFYRALYAGADGHAQNPLFYVSNSPWNMYDLFSDFFQMQDIPVGPVLILRDWGLTREGLAPLGARRYKTEAIRTILDAYPHLSFILLGDSGEHDPEIYAEIVAHAPGRILAVYIRNVTPHPRRIEAIQRLAEQVVAAGSTLILADNTLPLAQHAAGQGWIQPESLANIMAAKAADQAPPSPAEKLLGEEVAPRQESPTVVIKDEAPPTEAIQQALDEGPRQP